jgi:UDP-N-acetylmuramyl pentapeptide phosphotransferase/UDP-N-acetylglucosamine-1-phosphate transferase
MTVNWVTELIDYSENILTHLATDGVKYLVAFFGSLAVSLLLTPLCREAPRRVGMVDQPDARRIHKTPIPRGGGLSVFLTFHLMLGYLVLHLGTPLGEPFSLFWQGRFLIASGLLVAVGLADDKFGMRPLVKLFGQVAVALILYGSGIHVGGIVVAFPPWLDCLVTVFWIVGAINAFNLIDGMDGLAAGLALIASIGLSGALLFTGSSAATLPFLVLAGACLGFLRYNFHPASVFLGDPGCMFLGLCVATLPLMTGSRKELVTSLGMPLLAMGIPIFDTMLAIWRRSVRALLPQGVVAAGQRVRVMQPDKEHVHHRVLRITMNQRTAAVILYAASAALVLVGLSGTLLRGRAPGLFLIAFVVAIFVVVRHLERVELWDTGRLFSGERRPIRQGLLIPLYIVVDVFALCGVWIFARLLAEMPLGRLAFMEDLPLFIVPVFIFLVATKTYWRVWSRAQIRDFAVLGVAILAGTVVGVGLEWLFNDHEPNLLRFAVCFGMLAVFPAAGIRLWRDCVRGVMQILERRILLEKPETLRVLAYGGGLRFRSYLRELTERPGKNDRVIMGIIDDDLNLKGRIIAGHTVFGGMRNVLPAIAKHRIDGVVITCVMEPKMQARVVKAFEKLGVLVSVWACDEKLLSERHETAEAEGEGAANRRG